MYIYITHVTIVKCVFVVNDHGYLNRENTFENDMVNIIRKCKLVMLVLHFECVVCVCV